MKYKIIALSNICDLHTHSVGSGHAFSTIYELALQAMHLNLSYLGISDHAPAVPNGTNPSYFRKFSTLPSVISEIGNPHRTIKLLKGIELNLVGKEGDVDLDISLINRMDYIIISFHPNISPSGLSKQQHTDTFISAINRLKHKPIILGHLDNPKVPIDFKAILEFAKQYGALLEVNNSSYSGSRPGSFELGVQMVKMAKSIGNIVILNSDAHFHPEVGGIDFSLKVVSEADFPNNHIINYSEEMLNRFILSII